MKKSAYKELSSLEKTYWWHVGRMKIIDKQLSVFVKKSSTMLNVGSGTGGTLPILEKHCKVTNADMSTDAIQYLKGEGYDAVLFDGNRLPFDSNSFDVVASLDVLEHTPNDVTALKEWLRVLKPGGKLILTVPAYQWLWSSHDEDNLHFRRYSKRSLRKVINSQNKVTLDKLSYMIAFSLPLVVGFRLLTRGSKKSSKSTDGKGISNFVTLPKWVNGLFISFLSLEGTVLKRANLPAGTSLIAVITKNN